MSEVMRVRKLRWFGHMERKGSEALGRTVRLEVPGSLGMWRREGSEELKRATGGRNS